MNQTTEILALLRENKDLLESIYFAMLLIAAPLVAYTYIYSAFRALSEIRLENQRREERIFSDIDDRYTAWLRLVVQYPHLNVGYVALTEPRALSSDERVQQYHLFEVLVSLLERAFLAYRRAAGPQRARQWDGWIE